MTDRPTPETDLIEQGMFGSDPKLIADFARRLERERDEARDSAEKAKAYKRVLKQDNAKLRRERDELDIRLIEVSQFGVVAAIEREDLRTKLDDALAFNMRASRDASLYASMLHEKLEDERALADRLASVMFGCTARDMNDAYDAWKEARK